MTPPPPQKRLPPRSRRHAPGSTSALGPDGRGRAERAFIPAQHLLEEFGDMMLLTRRTISSALRPPYPYGGELVSQFLFTLRQVWFPLLVGGGGSGHHT